MKKTNVTIKDVAKEAGVSAATVSYVINNNKDQSISEATRQKIWQVVNMLNYKPSVYAKSLRMAPNSKLIAVYSDGINPLYKAEYMLILEKLFGVFSKSYELVFETKPLKNFNNVDAIITYNVSKETFYEIGNQNYVPLIALDSNINDPLFFQVNIDYANLKENADSYFNSDYTFVSLKPIDSSVEREIENTFNKVIFLNDSNDLTKVTEKNILTINDVVNTLLDSNTHNIYYNQNIIELKCKQVAKCIELALSHEPYDVHNYKI